MSLLRLCTLFLSVFSEFCINIQRCSLLFDSSLGRERASIQFIFDRFKSVLPGLWICRCFGALSVQHPHPFADSTWVLHCMYQVALLVDEAFKYWAVSVCCLFTVTF